jgi:CTP:molybdopterin cytidylyltransferase MocA
MTTGSTTVSATAAAVPASVFGFVIALAADAPVTSATMRIVVASVPHAISSPFFILPI